MLPFFLNMLMDREGCEIHGRIPLIAIYLCLGITSFHPPFFHLYMPKIHHILVSSRFFLPPWSLRCHRRRTIEAKLGVWERCFVVIYYNRKLGLGMEVGKKSRKKCSSLSLWQLVLVDSHPPEAVFFPSLPLNLIFPSGEAYFSITSKQSHEQIPHSPPFWQIRPRKTE